MKKDKNIYFRWMYESILSIEIYTKEHDAISFEASPLIRDACLMQLQHLGETANKCKTLFPEDASLPYKEMVGFRNFIAHDYIGIDIIEVWETIVSDIPILKRTLESLIDDSSLV